MNLINLKPTNNTPAITIDDKVLSIKGRSIPLSEANFYDPFIEWAKDLRSDVLTMEVKLEYMNSSSSKKLLHLMKTLDSNKNLELFKVNWYYEEGDEESKDHALMFQKLLKKAEFRIMKF